MTDEKLDQILQQALTPDIEDDDIHIYKRVRKNSMNKIFKIGIAVAACAALIFGVNVGGLFGGYASGDRNQPGVQAEITDNNPFVLTCFAAELDEGAQVPASLAGDVDFGSGLCGGEDGSSVSYLIGAKFACEGENIDSITYRINKGAFFITELKGASILTNYTDYSGPDLNCPGVSFDDGELEEGMDESEAKYDDHYVSEYTVSYDRQSSDTTMIGICGEKNDATIYNAVFGDVTLDQEVDARTSLMEGVEITCTVNYADGTADSKVIVVKGCVEKGGEDGTSEYANFAYELKQSK